MLCSQCPWGSATHNKTSDCATHPAAPVRRPPVQQAAATAKKAQSLYNDIIFVEFPGSESCPHDSVCAKSRAVLLSARTRRPPAQSTHAQCRTVQRQRERDRAQKESECWAEQTLACPVECALSLLSEIGMATLQLPCAARRCSAAATRCNCTAQHAAQPKRCKLSATAAPAACSCGGTLGAQNTRPSECTLGAEGLGAKQARKLLRRILSHTDATHTRARPGNLVDKHMCAGPHAAGCT